MVPRVSRSAVLIVSMALIVTGCGRQVSKEPSTDLDLLATSPAPEAVPVPRPFVAAAISATGGLDDWLECKRLGFDAVVTAYRQDGGFYLTEHVFEAYPWSDAIQVEAAEPRATFVWQVIGPRYRMVEGDRELDVSPVSGLYREYAEAVLQIATAPVRMLERSVSLTRRPTPIQLGGRAYHPIEATYGQEEVAAGEKAGEKTVFVEPYWKNGVYFQSQDTSLVDAIWLGNPIAQRFVIVRGYDYAHVADSGVLTPTKIEIFESGPEALPGRRLFLLDLRQ